MSDANAHLGSRPESATLPVGESHPAESSAPSRELVHAPRQQTQQRRSWIRNAGLLASVAAISASITSYLPFGSNRSIDPLDYGKRAEEILKSTPLIDGHNDLPYLIRVETKNKIYDRKLPFESGLLSHTDLKKMRQGKLGGQFWSVYVECPVDPDVQIDDPTWAVRDTLEQIDVTKRLVDEYSEALQYCDTAACAKAAFKSGKVGSFIGIEGGHQIGNSLAALRQVYDLGARYITVTHNCDNAFATAASTVAAGNPDLGLTEFGREFVVEMNRLGMLIDLSHVSHKTMRDVLAETKSPIIFSHSSSYALSKHLRNVPDDVLRSVSRNGGIVMATFLPKFLNVDDPASATIHDAADHILHIAEVAGWDHVGVGSDFDGTADVPKGLEDVSKYPRLIEILLERGATDEQLRKFTGDNLLRVWSEAESIADRIQKSGEKPNEETWSGRRWVRANLPLPFMFRNSAATRIPGKTFE